MSIAKVVCAYKQGRDCPIKADIYRVPSANAPSVLYIHGGALIFGSRHDIADGRIKMLNDAGFAVCSIDYRLAPETKLEYIWEDVEDALAWLAGDGARLFGLDPGRIAVMGNSAGGYLSLATGTFDVKPKAIVSFYGYGDILGDWYCKPSEFYCREPEVSKVEAMRVIGDREVTEGNRYKFYLYCRQQGIWTETVSGYSQTSEKDKIKRFCPSGQVGVDYPPTLLLHGDQDTDVPYGQSVQMAAELKKQGMDCELITIKDGRHGFDYDMKNPNVVSALEQVMKFLKKHLT